MTGLMDRTWLSAWQSFYVIVGSSAGALTGLQFVVVVLGAEKNVIKPKAARAFGTPTIVHFCAVLLVSALLSAPWHRLSGAAASLALCGLAGVVYLGFIYRHARLQTEYLPDVEDWLFHVVVPILTYAVVLLAALLLPRHPEPGLLTIAICTLILLFTGIHNAWDSVVYIATGQREEHRRVHQK